MLCLSAQVEPLVEQKDVLAFKHPALEISDEAILGLVQLALSCTFMPPSRRPDMKDVVSSLEASRKQLFGVIASKSDKYLDAKLRSSNKLGQSTSLERDLSTINLSLQLTRQQTPKAGFGSM